MVIDNGTMQCTLHTVRQAICHAYCQRSVVATHLYLAVAQLDLVHMQRSLVSVQKPHKPRIISHQSNSVKHTALKASEASKRSVTERTQVQLCPTIQVITVARGTCTGYLTNIVEPDGTGRTRSGLRSTSSTDYTLPRLRTKFAERPFSYAGPSAWNGLSEDLRAVADPAECRTQLKAHFLANVNSRSRSLYAVSRPSVVCLSSVCLSSVTLVHPTQAVQIFGNISTAFGTLAIR